MVSMEQRGEKAPDEVVKRFKLTIKGDQWTVTSSQGKGKPTALTITVDPSRDPKAIDLTARAGNREFVFPGIYNPAGFHLCKLIGLGTVRASDRQLTHARL